MTPSPGIPYQPQGLVLDALVVRGFKCVIEACYPYQRVLEIFKQAASDSMMPRLQYSSLMVLLKFQNPRLDYADLMTTAEIELRRFARAAL